MNYYDAELDSIANSIEGNLNKQSTLVNFFWLIFFLGFLLFIYLFIEYSGTKGLPPFYALGVVILLTSSFLGFIYENNRREKIFKNMREKLFFYLFYSWKYHNDEKSKKYLKELIDELDTYLDDYKQLAYTEEIYSTFDALRDTLIYHVYPRLGVRGPFEKQEDLTKQTSAWNEFKSLSLDFYHNVSITSINAKISTMKSFFERDETIKLDDESKSIKMVKTFSRWNSEMYKNSLAYRFLFYAVLTIIVDYFLVSKNILDINTILPATILIPFAAPYYLAPKTK